MAFPYPLLVIFLLKQSVGRLGKMSLDSDEISKSNK